MGYLRQAMARFSSKYLRAKRKSFHDYVFTMKATFWNDYWFSWFEIV